MSTLNGYIMSKDKAVARFENGLVQSVEEKAPLYFHHRKDVEGWLRLRQIDGHRTHSRLLKKALRISATNDLGAVLRFHAATITDCYWLKQEGEDINYSDVMFTKNPFASLALSGDPNAFSLAPEKTPELTNIGSFEKCWVKRDDGWYMLKNGNTQELFSELFIARFCEAIGYPVALYDIEDKHVKSKDFTDAGTVCLEAMDTVFDEEDDYEICFERIGKLSEQYFGDKTVLQKQYLQILIVDSVCYNMDRHAGNFGFLRDPETGKVVSMAPNYDNNIALVAKGMPNLNRDHDGLMRFFKDFVEENEGAKQLAKAVMFEPLSEEDVQRIIDEMPIHTSRAEDICQFIMNGQGQMMQILNIPYSRVIEKEERELH